MSEHVPVWLAQADVVATRFAYCELEDLRRIVFVLRFEVRIDVVLVVVANDYAVEVLFEVVVGDVEGTVIDVCETDLFFELVCPFSGLIAPVSLPLS